MTHKPKFLKSSDPSRVKRLTVFVKQIDIIFFCSEFTGTSQSINLSSIV
jgi:hypothetical protein